MRALVTGSTGFVGGGLCRLLIDRGWQVRAFRRESSLLTRLEGLPVEHYVGDLIQPETLAGAMQDVDVVFHAAAILGDRVPLEKRLAVTVGGTANVLSAARQAGVKRFVHISSVAALGIPEQIGTNGRQGLMDETHAWNEQPERWSYGYSKYLAEVEVQKAVAGGQDAVIVNPSYILGAGDVYKQSVSVLMRMKEKQLPFLVEGGLNIIHIADLLEGVYAAAESGRTGERYLLTGQNLTISEFIKTAATVLRVTPPSLVLPYQLVQSMAGISRVFIRFLDLPLNPELFNQAGRYFYYSNEKAQKELSWQPKRTVEEAILEAMLWYQRTE